jgi:hypothetical protein
MFNGRDASWPTNSHTPPIANTTDIQFMAGMPVFLDFATIVLFAVHLLTLSVTQTVLSLMLGYFINKRLENIWLEAAVA